MLHASVGSSPLIRLIRDVRVILDTDLALLYGVETRALVQAVKRNADRFPEDFLFQLTAAEAAALRSQIVISKTGRGGRRYPPQVNCWKRRAVPARAPSMYS